jgi:hypothetical protein
MPVATFTSRVRRRIAIGARPHGVTTRRWRIRVPERALLGAAMSGALLIAERRLNRMQTSRDA